MGDFYVFETAAHTMTEEGFCHLKTLLVESGMSAQDFTRTLLFCRLQIASTVNNFSSEKVISLMSTPAFKLVKKNLCSSQSFFFLEVCEALMSLHFERRHLKLVLSFFLIIFSLTFMSWAITLMDLLRLHLGILGIWGLQSSTIFWDCAGFWL